MSQNFKQQKSVNIADLLIWGDRGTHQRAIIALGKQDNLISGLSCDRGLEILGSSSDHVVLDSKNSYLKIGVGVKFNLDYGSLLAAMTSPFIKKQFT